MNLDLHFPILFSVVGKRLLSFSANIYNKLSGNRFSSKRRVFVSSSNKMQVENVMANISQSTEFVYCSTGMTLILAHLHLLATIRIFVALQYHLIALFCL